VEENAENRVRFSTIVSALSRENINDLASFTLWTPYIPYSKFSSDPEKCPVQ